ncbi:MAG: YybH family protein [Terriglobia bacterium]
MRKVGIALILLVLATSGCAQPVDVEAEAAAIRAVDHQMQTAANAGDIARWFGFFTDDAIMMPPNEPAVVGKEAIREYVSALMASANLAVSHDLSKVEVSRGGDLAYVSYAYEIVLTPPEGEAVTDRGKDITVFKKQLDGSWKVVIDIWNSDQLRRLNLPE